MMKIKYTPKAREDLRNIKETIKERFFNEELAIKILSEITKTIRDLETFPQMGRNLSELVEIPTEYRYLFCSHNYVFYRIDKENIFIIRVLNEKQDYMRILFGISEVDE